MLLTQARHVFYIALATADGNSERRTVPGTTARGGGGLCPPFPQPLAFLAVQAHPSRERCVCKGAPTPRICLAGQA